MLKLTPSRIREYQACPLQYRLKYVDGFASSALAASPALSFGNSLHSALEQLHRHGSARVTADDIPALLRKHWKGEGYANPTQEGEQFAVGVEALQKYLVNFGAVSGAVLGLELFLSSKVALGGLQFELVCRADRVEMLPDGRLEVLDYKTNADGQLPSAESLTTDLATFVYYLLARVSYSQFTQVKVSQLNLLSLVKVCVEYSETQRAENKAGLLKLVQDIEASRFEPRPGVYCRWCSVREHCPAVNAVVTLESL